MRNVKPILGAIGERERADDTIWVQAGVQVVPQRGVVRCIVPQPGDERALASLLIELRGKATCVAERVPPAIWRKITSPGGNDAVVGRVRQAFDPDAILNPGIL